MHTLLDLQLPVAMRDFIKLRILPLIERFSGLINRSSYSPLEIQTVGVELTEKSQRLADVVELVGVALLVDTTKSGLQEMAARTVAVATEYAHLIEAGLIQIATMG